ncbi:hypothetical protein BP00DRAFT_65861 [Aspergillus indologenus CBS 114.80]|uniref:Uncharacterized protein n=1 Tax=Aspergillus indologenus CBS 114.80 TaxID=1450541 RepID=A0A2V5IK33_9EURO|nr:hypothetical protein BP00DRAFT_65861 [Aspergillus indologenus CBS 114.80]
MVWKFDLEIDAGRDVVDIFRVFLVSWWVGWDGGGGCCRCCCRCTVGAEETFLSQWIVLPLDREVYLLQPSSSSRPSNMNLPPTLPTDPPFALYRNNQLITKHQLIPTSPKPILTQSFKTPITIAQNHRTQTAPTSQRYHSANPAIEAPCRPMPHLSPPPLLSRRQRRQSP